MPRLSSQQIAEKAARNAAAAQQDYVAGVQRVQTAPGQRAAAKKAVYVQNVQASADKWATRVAAVDLGTWQARTVEKASRFGTGVQAAIPKTTAFWDKFGPHLDAVTAKVRAMPNDTQEQRINRAVEQMRGAAQFKR